MVREWLEREDRCWHELLLTELKLPTMRQLHAKLAKEVAGAGGDFTAYLLGLLEEEVGERRSRRVARRMKEAREKHTLHRYLRRFACLDLAIIDELGYLPIGEHGADLLFQALSERRRRRERPISRRRRGPPWGARAGPCEPCNHHTQQPGRAHPPNPPRLHTREVPPLGVGQLSMIKWVTFRWTSRLNDLKCQLSQSR